MSNVADEPAAPERKALIVWWDPATNEIELDDLGNGLSVFDKAGILSVALDIAAEALPSIGYAIDSTED